MAYITLTEENIEKEHICCAFSDRKCTEGYEAKKEWLRNEIPKGYTFYKLDARAKVFIEFAPSEIAYLPVDAPDCMGINCFWVSGRYKKHGHGEHLLKKCIADSKAANKQGIVVLSSHKKRPFMADKKFMMKYGFEVVDQAEPYFELLYLPLKKDSQPPTFLDSVRPGTCEEHMGFRAYYSPQCPFMAHYLEQQVRVAEEKGYTYEQVLIDSREKAFASPSPFTIFSLYYKAKFVTHVLGTEKNFRKTIDQIRSDQNSDKGGSLWPIR